MTNPFDEINQRLIRIESILVNINNSKIDYSDMPIQLTMAKWFGVTNYIPINCKTLGQLASYTEVEFSRLKGIGPVKLNEIKRYLKIYNLSFKETTLSQ